MTFRTLSGELTVEKRNDLYEMDFPAYELKPVLVTEQIIDTIGSVPVEAYMGRDLLCVLDSEDTVRRLQPDQEKVKALDGLLLQVTAQGTNTDCISRSFAPKCAAAEDPVCGSGSYHIIPYWADKFGKDEITAYQASQRGGMLYCRLEGKQVMLAGNTALYAAAELFI